MASQTPTHTSYTKPLLKWAGGKSKLLTAILPHFPRSIHHYYEPFLGGGSVLFALLNEVEKGTIRLSGNVYASDANPILIAFYEHVQMRPEELINEIKRLATPFRTIQETTTPVEPTRTRSKKRQDIAQQATTYESSLQSKESYYYWLRNEYNRLIKEVPSIPTITVTSLFYVLNKTCFRGLYREGPNGFNVPYGHYANPAIIDEAHFHTVSRLLQRVSFSVRPYQAIISHITPADFVYMDPPYVPEKEKSFVSYTADGFAEEDHTRLFEMCHQLIRTNIPFIMSNAYVKTVMDAFSNPENPSVVILFLDCRRAIHSTKPETITKEVLICATSHL